jgi:Flp pilus assembly protein TadB
VSGPVARLGTGYRRSRGARRLEHRLRRAMIDTTPARWRLGQLLLALPLAALAAAVLGPVLGVAMAAGAVRAGARLVLRAGSDRRAEALERAAPLLARCLGAELAGGAGAQDALVAAAASLPGDERVLHPILRTALARTSLGETPGLALAATVAAEPDGGRGLVTVATLLAVQGRAGGDPASFDRLAAALEAAIAVRDDARALTAEARLAAVAVPALAAVLAVTLVLTEPAIGAGITSPVALAALGGCAAIALAGSAVARRLATLS